jgi:DNA-binding NarL/FixJ family response regulator
VNGAIAAFENAVVASEDSVLPFERGRALLALGSEQRRTRQRRAARETLEAALEIFAGLGADLWAEQTRSELGRIGGRTPSGDGLTPTEQRVAELVSEGKSNKEAAAELVVSVHTVEAALTSIYRKLDVHSRTEMAAKLAEHV